MLLKDNILQQKAVYILKSQSPGSLDIHGVVALEFPHQMGLISVAILIDGILNLKIRICQDIIPQKLIAHEVDEPFRSDADIIMKEPLQLPVADKRLSRQTGGVEGSLFQQNLPDGAVNNGILPGCKKLVCKKLFRCPDTFAKRGLLEQLLWQKRVKPAKSGPHIKKAV